MPTCKTSLTRATLFVALLAAPVPVFAQAATKAERKLRHEVKQANLYIKMKLPARARELLEAAVEQEPGRSTGLAWLALGRAYFYERRIDDAGRAMARAESLGVQFPKKGKWAKRFSARFKRHVGAVVLDGGPCGELAFDAQLAAPMPHKTRNALLSSVRDWRTGTLTRTRGERFYLPVGRYRFGKLRVKVIASELARVSADEIGAKCALGTETPPVAAAPVPAPTPGGAPPPLEPLGRATPRASIVARPQEEASWIEDNWVWVLVGAVVVAGATATAVALTVDGGPDQVNFNPNPPSFRN